VEGAMRLLQVRRPLHAWGGPPLWPALRVALRR
jgi:hypothetical protein